MSIIYRVLLPNESKIYREIRLESLKTFPDSFEVKYEDSAKQKKLAFEIEIENQSIDRFVCGAFDDEKLIGICTFAKDKNGNGNIIQMFVKPEYQGQNIGKYLLEFILKEAKNRFPKTSIFLEVAKDNLSAFRLYKKAGFKIEKESEDDRIVLMKYS
ncbi:GNAT family N-acetyltransferase [Soonwooa sp.]|uniref:GNAT family N-acetyltransferase n=1 Tax=Soonwooa sp. TaxID=1938592 RepID=UPI00262BE523|nr:GNAT family N-acetyltransferase [Soonwooa sp.]